MNPLDYVKAIIGAALLATVFFFGRSCGASGGEKQRIQLERTIDDKNDALRKAALALTQAKQVLQSITANTESEKARADQWMQAGQEAAKAATRDAKTYGTRITSLEAQLARERAGCTEGRARICGTPLR